MQSSNMMSHLTCMFNTTNSRRNLRRQQRSVFYRKKKSLNEWDYFLCTFRSRIPHCTVSAGRSSGQTKDVAVASIPLANFESTNNLLLMLSIPDNSLPVYFFPRVRSKKQLWTLCRSAGPLRWPSAHEDQVFSPAENREHDMSEDLAKSDIRYVLNTGCYKMKFGNKKLPSQIIVRKWFLLIKWLAYESRIGKA